MADPAFQQNVDNAVQLSHDYALAETSNIVPPVVGMVFDSPDNAFQFYKEYSCKVGFGITRRSSHNYYGFKYAVTFSCNKNRKPTKSNDDEGFVERNRGILGTGCKAHIKLKDQMLRGSWRVEEVCLQHNHQLFPDSVWLMRCHREIPSFVKKQLEINEMAGLAQHKSITAVFTQAGGVTRCTFTERDMRNYVSELRRLQLREGDAAALMRYFHEQQDNNPRFFYSLDVDDDGRLRNVFWADARSRVAYSYFSDVLTFDTTYLTNRYRMPFAVFVGVNHHGQSILLGCALLSNELSGTFAWLFKTLMTCMRNKAPQAIITDQCGAICSALSEVLPNTRHRLCLWHILKKLPEKLSGVQDRENIMDTICNIVYDSHTETEFEERWTEFMKESDVGQNRDWFTNLYDMRAKWVPAFVKHEFWAGMSTTQHSESMNAFFDGYINSRTSLKAFVEKYNAALHSKWEKERQEDWRCMETKPKLISNYKVEAQFAEAYTLKVFYMFQREIKLLISCFCEIISTEDTQLVFRVSEVDVKHQYIVAYNTAAREYKCDCKLFEFKGIICRHGLCVYRQLRIDFALDHYLLPRWRKDYVRSHTLEIVPDQFVYRDLLSYDTVYMGVNQIIQELIELGSRSQHLRDYLQNRLNTIKQDMSSLLDVTCAISPSSTATAQCEIICTVKDPLVVRSKGRPRKNRFTSGVENRKNAKTKANVALVKMKKSKKTTRIERNNKEIIDNPEEDMSLDAQMEEILPNITKDDHSVVQPEPLGSKLL